MINLGVYNCDVSVRTNADVVVTIANNPTASLFEAAKAYVGSSAAGLSDHIQAPSTRNVENDAIANNCKAGFFGFMTRVSGKDQGK